MSLCRAQTVAVTDTVTSAQLTVPGNRNGWTAGMHTVLGRGMHVNAPLSVVNPYFQLFLSSV